MQRNIQIVFINKTLDNNCINEDALQVLSANPNPQSQRRTDSEKLNVD